MRNLKKLSCILLFLLLYACGQKAPALPSEYTIAEDGLPSLQEALSISNDEYQFSESMDSGADSASYTYSKLESSNGITNDYISFLENEEDCFVIDESGAIQDNPNFSKTSGNVLVGKESTSGNGVFVLDISWQEGSCTISPTIKNDIEIHNQSSYSDEEENSLTLDEMVDLFESFSPEELGLPGGSMSDYDIFPEEGFVLVDKNPCIKINFYQKSTHRYQATYLISSDGTHIYQLNRQSDKVTELSL